MKRSFKCGNRPTITDLGRTLLTKARFLTCKGVKTFLETGGLNTYQVRTFI